MLVAILPDRAGFSEKGSTIRAIIVEINGNENLA
jgi:hypothetical protein